MDQDARKRLSDLITRARGELSQHKFGSTLGVSQSAIQSWEKGTKLPDLDSLELLAEHLGMQPGDLLNHVYPSDDKDKEEIVLMTAEEVLEAIKLMDREEKKRLIGILVASL